MIAREKLRTILEKHEKWFLGESGGKRAMLMGENLKYADLAGANLIGADLRGADLKYADLAGANLIGADLRGADLTDANLIGADLADVDLIYADLTDANLIGADLSHTLTDQIKGKSVISVQVDTSRPNNIISYWVDLGVWTTGCFQGSLDELKEKIEETHKDNTFLRERYYRVIHFILQEADEDNGRIEVEE